MFRMVPKETEEKIRQLKSRRYEIIVGIPSYNNSKTISHVVKMADDGIKKYFNGNGLIVNSDGGSSDNTAQAFYSAETISDKISFVYQGVAGKGSAMGSVMEISKFLSVPVTVFVDSDLRSIEPWWIERLTSPIIQGKASYVTPYYVRHKYDGTITNNICYPLTSALYGQKIRQPIGGDFGVSLEMIDKYLSKPLNVWQSDVGRFGIDIWMTTTAICEGENPVWQAALGAKIHDVKDPGKQLGPMFKQVVGTLFGLMEEHEKTWLSRSEKTRPAPIYGKIPDVTPEPLSVDLDNLKRVTKNGLEEYWSFMNSNLPKELIEELENSKINGKLKSETWIKAVYEFAVLYRNKNLRENLIKSLIPLYFGRVADFVENTLEKPDEIAEKLIEEQLEEFENMKPYLIKRWNA
ncbi:cell wall biosynthesis glycosyltransferase [Mesoaciditoga lauensis]|uniref:cell wall biosynthesis glycosyltransferase n=1 Tax=Mesoaciditoga lauensis TaxID=1495039 RepID=UPI000A9EBB91|nr:cell wall biosynthesis glycosyltransferase [Mesoaciditoga lauensis]